MKNKTIARTLEFTVEKTETLTIRRTNNAPLIWCGECGLGARMLKPDDAALATGISTRQIYALIESGRAHFVELAAGRLMVCHRSLVETERAGNMKEDPPLLVSNLLKES